MKKIKFHITSTIILFFIIRSAAADLTIIGDGEKTNTITQDQNSYGNLHINGIDNIFTAGNNKFAWDTNFINNVGIFGNSNNLSGVYSSTIVGYRNTVTNADVNVFGGGNKVQGIYGSVFGDSNEILYNTDNVNHDVVYETTTTNLIGSNNKLTNASSIVMGNTNVISGQFSVVLGNLTNVEAANSVTLGQESENYRDNTVSVGSKENKRQITNVANATEDNDAVNLSQLNVVDGKVTTNTNNINALGEKVTTNTTNIKNIQTSIENGDFLTWNSATNSYSATRGSSKVNRISNVANAKEDNDAVNLSQLNIVDGKVTKNTDDINALGEKVTTNTTNIQNIQTSIENGDFLTWNTSSEAYSATRGSSKVNRISNVANAKEDNDAVNLSQLNVVDKKVTANTNNINNIQSSITNITTSGDFLTWNSVTNSYSATRGESTYNKISNVANATEDNDAVNLYQLNVVDNKVAENTTNIQNIQTSIENGDFLTWNTSSEAYSATRGSSKVNRISNVANAKEDNDAVNLSQLNVVNEKVTANTNNINNIQSSITNITTSGDFLTWNSVTNSYSATRGESTYNKISNVANATENNDAVNLFQLNSVKNDLTSKLDKLGDQVNQNTTSINNGVSNSDLTELQKTVTQNTTNITQNTSDIADLKNSVAQNTSDIANINNQISDIKTNGAGSALIQNNPGDKTVKANATASNSLAVGSGSQATANNAIALGTNSVADRENTVSIGSKGSERQITNVKAGTEDTDAVNFSQLKQVQTSQKTFEKSTNLKFQSVYEKMEQNQKENRSGISSAMAMSAIPQAFQYGSGMMGLGIASYKGESALAVGVSRVSENGRWITKLNGSTNSNNDLAISFGIGYSW